MALGCPVSRKAVPNACLKYNANRSDYSEAEKILAEAAAVREKWLFL